MKLNLDLIRDILKDITNHNGTYDLGSDNLHYESFSNEIVNYHIRELIHEGYLKAIDASDKLGLCYLAIELTMPGQSFYEMIEKETLWQKTKEAISKGADITGIAAIEAVVTSIVQKML